MPSIRETKINTVFKEVEAHQPISILELCKLTGMNHGTVKFCLKKLKNVRKVFVNRVEKLPNGYSRIFFSVGDQPDMDIPLDNHTLIHPKKDNSLFEKNPYLAKLYGVYTGAAA